MYALLVVSKEPLTANQLAEELNISRGNVSMGIKELQSWQLINRKHLPGDRKEYYQALGTIWDMAMKVFEERRSESRSNTFYAQRCFAAAVMKMTKMLRQNCMKFTTYWKL